MATVQTEIKVTPEIAAEHGVTRDEYARIQKILGRDPNITELGIFSVMWSEHCSYKSSKVHLKRLPTRGKLVVQGPGENAGVVDIGDGLVAAFKIESHNHPSYVEPFQGATTGVGGILRDIFTMGARPIAVLDSLRFGEITPGKNTTAKDAAKNRRILDGVIRGIGSYGNCFGVPTVGGEVAFEPCYSQNPLVNALALGIAKKEEIFLAKAKGIGNPVIYVGAKTGRDGIHGASLLASAEFTEESKQKRPNVQVGDPFMEKLLLEACLEAMQTGAVVAIQDMGAAGLTSSSCEMASRGGLGIEIELARVPQREPGMTADEMMLSESQERMLLAAPAIASKRWIWEQYDYMVRTNTLEGPGASDAAVVRIKGTKRALALAADGNGRWCRLDPFVGAQLAVAEAARNVACSGAKPMAATNCLNFGSPEKPEVMWQFSRAVDGIAEACTALEIPITGGNVSFYNETLGRSIDPTPVLGVLGMIEDASRALGMAFRAEGDVILLFDGNTAEVNTTKNAAKEFSSSEYARTIRGVEAGAPPAVNLAAEKRLLAVLAALAGDGKLQSAHDVSDGGLAVTLAESCFVSDGFSTRVSLNGTGPDEAALFGERGARAIVSVTPENLAAVRRIAAQYEVAVGEVGRVTRGEFRIELNGQTVVSAEVSSLADAWANALERAVITK